MMSVRSIVPVLLLSLAACGGGGSGGSSAPQNQPPLAAGNSYSIAEDTLLSIPTGTGVLANDSDPEGALLTAVLVQDAAYGSLTLNPDGSFTYDSNSNFAGADQFTYQAVAGGQLSAVATVSIDVLPVADLPDAGDDSWPTPEDAPLAISTPGVLANDTDADGDPLAAYPVGQPSHGSLSLNTDGSFIYVPYGDYNGTDSFSYRVLAGGGYSNVATVSINVTALDDAPVATDAMYPTDGAGALSLAAPGLLAHASDIDGDGITAILVDPPSDGSLVLNPDGSFTYAGGGFTGMTRFTWKASDGSLPLSGEATVWLLVNVAGPGAIYGVRISEGGVLEYPAGGGEPQLLPNLPVTGSPEILLDEAGTFLFMLSGSEILKYDLALNTVTTLATGPFTAGLDFDPDDPEGWIYTVESNGTSFPAEIHRIHPVTGEHQAPFSNPGYPDGGYFGGITVGQDPATGGTAIYLTPIDGVGAMAGWLYKQGVDSVTIVGAPPGDAAFMGLNNIGGAVTDRDGNVYAVGIWDDTVFRYVDVNSDGTFLNDPIQAFATLPVTDEDFNSMLYHVGGLTIGPEGTLLVNVMSTNQGGDDDLAHGGIYWVMDADQFTAAPDGTPAEIVMRYSDRYAQGGDQCNVVSAKR